MCEKKTGVDAEEDGLLFLEEVKTVSGGITGTASFECQFEDTESGGQKCPGEGEGV